MGWYEDQYGDAEASIEQYCLENGIGDSDDEYGYGGYG